MNKCKGSVCKNKIKQYTGKIIIANLFILSTQKLKDGYFFFTYTMYKYIFFKIKIPDKQNGKRSVDGSLKMREYVLT
jgi:hypothetical protein